MSKSIYEEALEKIVVEFSSWDIAEHLELFELVEHALEQAQKQEKELKIYKDVSNYVCEQTCAITRLKIIIKELEK